MTNEERALAELHARDAELARLRDEEARRRGRDLVIGESDLSPETIRRMVSQYGRTLATREDEEAGKWAEERFTLRRSRIERAKIRLDDDEVVGVATLMPEPIDEPPIDDIHRRRIDAMAALRVKFAPNLPAFEETPALAAVRTTLRERAERRIEQRFVVLYGMIGTSKTSAGAHAIASVNGGACVDARIFCDLHGSFAREDRATVARLYDAPILLIDELRPDLFATRNLGTALSDVIYVRRAGRMVTIMTTNVKPKDLADALTPQAKSRAAGHVKWVKSVGADLRAKRKTGG